LLQIKSLTLLLFCRYITETQKVVSRIHLVDRELVAALCEQATASAVAKGAAATFAGPARAAVPTPLFPAFPDANLPDGAARMGLAVVAILENHLDSEVGDVIASSAVPGRRGNEPADAAAAVMHGVEVKVGTKKSITITFGDGVTAATHTTDPLCTNVLTRPGKHFWAAVADGGARILTMMVDGVLCDGGGVLDQGWEWFGPISGSVRGADHFVFASNYSGSLLSAHVYNRRLSTSELVGSFHALM
jgi:hypothetical protein